MEWVSLEKRDSPETRQSDLLFQEATLIPLTTSHVSQKNLSTPEVELVKEKIDV